MLTVLDEVIVTGGAADGESAVRQIGALRPELVFLDVRMPALPGIDAGSTPRATT